jgi:predicted component of type VI protein secretion system
MRRGTLVLGLLLALTACSVTVTVPLPPQEVKVPVASDTMGLIV